MSNFRLIAAGVDTSAILAELDAQPELWNTRTYRTEDPTSPHNGVDDIWLRWRAEEECTTAERINEMHYPVFWPAWHALPSLHPIVRNLSHAVNATALGGILLTQTPAGGCVRPHTDSGWHASFFNTKVYLTLKSDPKCLVHCGDDYQNFREGDVWSYPNNIIHSVCNDGRSSHQNVIICFRVET